MNLRDRDLKPRCQLSIRHNKPLSGNAYEMHSEAHPRDTNSRLGSNACSERPVSLGDGEVNIHLGNPRLGEISVRRE